MPLILNNKTKKLVLNTENNILKDIQKVYLGNKLIYTLGTFNYVSFESVPWPEDWTKVNDLKYTATNDYGEWVITSSGIKSSSSEPLSSAFDNSTASFFDTERAVPRWVKITLPNDISIKPETINVWTEYSAKTNIFQGYDPSTSEWVTIGTSAYHSNSRQEDVFTYSGDTYFTEFRFYSTEAYNTNYNYLEIFEIQVVKGMMKVYSEKSLNKKTGSFLPTLDSTDIFTNNTVTKENVIFTYGNASNTSIAENSTKEFYKVFDKDSSTYADVRHAGSATEDGWFIINFGELIAPTKITYIVANEKNTSAQNEPYSILGSVDGTTWDTLWSVTQSIDYHPYTFDISCNDSLTEYQYIKIVWDNAKSGVQDMPDIYDFQITEWYKEE